MTKYNFITEVGFKRYCFKSQIFSEYLDFLVANPFKGLWCWFIQYIIIIMKLHWIVVWYQKINANTNRCDDTEESYDYDIGNNLKRRIFTKHRLKIWWELCVSVVERDIFVLPLPLQAMIILMQILVTNTINRQIIGSHSDHW